MHVATYCCVYRVRGCVHARGHLLLCLACAWLRRCTWPLIVVSSVCLAAYMHVWPLIVVSTVCVAAYMHVATYCCVSRGRGCVHARGHLLLCLACSWLRTCTWRLAAVSRVCVAAYMHVATYRCVSRVVEALICSSRLLFTTPFNCIIILIYDNHHL